MSRPPDPGRLADSLGWGAPQIRMTTGQGTASVWLLRAADSVYLVAAIPDSTFHWDDELVVSLDTEGDRADTPQHDDFQWDLRRNLDSSAVYRGRAGRWDAPQGDPDWRLRKERSGAGWSVRAAETVQGKGWTLVLRLDAGWLALAGDGPGLSVRLYDDSPGGWSVWPTPPQGTHPLGVERQPALWGPVIPTAPAASSGGGPRGAPGTRP